MLRPTRLFLVCSILTVCTLSVALGQGLRKDPSDKTLIVTASATSDGVRIAAPNTVVQLRLEVYDDAGQKLFDTEQRGGNVIDWHLQGGAQERLADGAYLCVVTSKSLSGRLSQKLGLVTVNAQSATLRSAAVAELSLRQAQAVGPIEGEDEGLAVVPPEDAQSVTVLANNGDEAQLARTRGALTFRNGDFFSGTDKEQMRLTEEGNLGIGTAKPKAKLDVAGMIRAREGFAFADGSKLNVNDKGALTLTNSNGIITPNVAGTGTQDQVAKWTDNAGTLGNSSITELNGKVGIGTTNPSGQLHIFGTATQDVFAGMGPDLALGPALNFGYAGSSFGRGAGFFNVRPDAGATPPNPSLRFATANVERMIVTNTGNVGIGTTNPGAKLDVAGNIKLSGPNSSLMFSDGTSMITAASGVTMSGTSIVNAVNDPATAGVISDARLSPNVAKLNSANTFTSSQTVNGNVAASGSVTAGGNVMANGFITTSGSITAGGQVQSNSGGFRFPDGTVQSTAVAASPAGQTYTTFPFGGDIEIGKPISEPGGGTVEILTLNDLPGGSYMVTASIQFENRAIFNKRLVACQVIDEGTWFFRIEGQGGSMDQMPVTIHTLINHGGTIKVYCQAIDGSGRSNILARARRLTAIRLGNVVTQ